ncbi:hypothetical protein K7432_011263 [Basidiobolus ranarum]|uniref:Uncharacterized protein n=1 Tax=Basidiobolus ranarum TaxID=34480 RepID=A0ABR2VU56_9FUNG
MLTASSASAHPSSLCEGENPDRTFCCSLRGSPGVYYDSAPPVIRSSDEIKLTISLLDEDVHLVDIYEEPPNLSNIKVMEVTEIQSQGKEGKP